MKTYITEPKWQIIKNAFSEKTLNRKRKCSLFNIYNFIVHVIKTGSAWRDLQCEPDTKWQTVYGYFYKWRSEGVFEEMRRLAVASAMAGEELDELIFDAQSVKTKCGGPVGYDGGKKVKGRKRHIAVNLAGLIVATVVTAANISENKGGIQLSDCISRVYEGPKTVWADQGYKKTFVQRLTNVLGWAVNIVRGVAGEGFKVQPKRWIVERSFAWLGIYRRLNCDYEKTIESSLAVMDIAATMCALKKCKT